MRSRGRGSRLLLELMKNRHLSVAKFVKRFLNIYLPVRIENEVLPSHRLLTQPSHPVFMPQHIKKAKSRAKKALNDGELSNKRKNALKQL